MRPELEVKIHGLFDMLEEAIDSYDIDKADIVLGKLSKYFHLFDDELTDYYQYAQYVVERSEYDTDYE